MVKISPGGDLSKDVLQGMTNGVIVQSESEYRELVKANQLPKGYEWTRSSFGAPKGEWKATIRESPEIHFADTGLEQTLRERLQNWGYWPAFTQDYRTLGRQIDFADTSMKVALEPGAVYWHTPDGCEGRAEASLGEHPEEVYSPAQTTDIEKQRTLRDDGWDVLWMTEKGVENEPETIKDWLDNIYQS